MSRDWKKDLGVVFSTDDNFSYDSEEDSIETLIPEEQNLTVSIDKKQRKGKVVVLVDNFIGKDEDLKKLSKMLKTKCGVGGSVKEGQIIIQGNLKDKVVKFLQENRYNVKTR